MEIIQSKMFKVTAIMILLVILISVVSPVFAASKNEGEPKVALSAVDLSGIGSFFKSVIETIASIIKSLFSSIQVKGTKAELNKAQKGTVTTTNVVKNTNNNILDTSKTVYQGKKYTNLTDKQKKQLAYLAKKEQGSIEGAKIELSLMANLTESKGYSCVYDYAIGTGKKSWFGPVKRGEIPENPTISDAYVKLVDEILVDGKRYLPNNVVEHDCFSDISKITTNKTTYTNKNDIKNRKNYVPNDTVIYNKYGAKYVFIGFAPNNGDPFGYFK